MSPIGALFNPTLLGAIAVYGMAALALEIAAEKLAARFSDQPLLGWQLDHVFVPLGRAACITLFVLAAYPAVFGLAQAPPLAEVLAGDKHRINTLVNLAFFVSLLLPLVPVLGTRIAWVLPLQGIAISALLLHWTGAHLGREVTLWPGWTVAGSVLFSAGLAGMAARPLARVIATIWEYEPVEQRIFGSLAMLLQLPPILIYTLNVGLHP